MKTPFYQLPHLMMLLFVSLLACNTEKSQEVNNQSPIDREALVTRHNVHLSAADSLNSLSVGNGEFAFTVDISGLQSFPEYYENGVALGTKSQWGWHSIPSAENYSLDDVAVYDTSCTGKAIPFAVQHKEGRAGKATTYLRTNPHRLHLGLIGLELMNQSGQKITIDTLQNVSQTLNLWTGEITSTYEIDGTPVKVNLYAHQEKDEISASITSDLIKTGQLQVSLKFPYGATCHVCPGYDFNSPDKHKTTLLPQDDQHALFERKLDTTTYYTAIEWEGQGTLDKKEAHYYVLKPDTQQSSFTFSVAFSKDSINTTTPYEQTAQNSIENWKAFWKSGGAIDFSECTDPRAKELERRVVLSQYLTKIQCAGSLPPQETGLTFNSWYGKFHLEMHWWHGVHFALWNRLPLLEKSLDWYDRVQDKAQHTAKWQGFEGVRWQKMTDPYGNESPSGVGTYLVWQQPHIIYFAELAYRQNPTQETLNRFKDRVFETAAFMADYAQPLEDGHYHLCAPIKPAQELFPANETKDPPFEMCYWYYALSIAEQWKERLGLPQEDKWQNVIDHLAPLAIKDSLYLPSATHPMAYTDDFYRRDHPVVLGALGMIPQTPLIDTALMSHTYAEIIDHWQWDTTWGWDYPMMAMCAARLGHPEDAIDALFMDLQKNTYLKNGHNFQDDRLRIYLPGNGGLLTAVAMMAAGWDGSTKDNPGFPDNGKWNVKWEGLAKMP